MSNVKAIMVVKQSALSETIKELGDSLAGENVVVKVEKDYVFDSMFDLNTETIDIDIEDDVLLTLMKMAHEKNITFNQLVTEILMKQIEKENVVYNTPVTGNSNSYSYTHKDGGIMPCDTSYAAASTNSTISAPIFTSTAFAGEEKKSKVKEKQLNGLVDELLKKRI